MNKDKIINRCNRITILLKEEAPSIIINNEVEHLVREVKEYQTINKNIENNQYTDMSDNELHDKYVDYCIATMGDALSFDQWKKLF